MADLIKLQPDELENTVGLMTKITNEQTIDSCVQLANVLNEIKGNEPIVDTCYDGLREFQKQYNEAREGIEAVLKNFKATCEVAEWMSKQSANLVQGRAVGFDVKKMDASKVIQ